MSNVLNRRTFQFLESVSTHKYPKTDWIINPDLSAVKDVPKKHWKIAGDVITKMKKPERVALERASQKPQKQLKREKHAAVDVATVSLISEGFFYDGNMFSLSLAAQIRWGNIKSHPEEFSFPVAISTVQSNTYLLEEDNVQAFWAAHIKVLEDHLESGRELNKVIFDATSREEVESINDNR